MLIALPLLAIPVLLYTLIVIFGMDGGFTAAGADAALRDSLFTIPMTSGASWTVGPGDLLILFVVCLIAFLLLRGFATSTFFLITVMVLLDVLAGFIVTIISARKDFDIGTAAG